MTTTLGRVLARQLRRGLHDLVRSSDLAEQSARSTFTAAVNVGATEVEIFDRSDKRLQHCLMSVFLLSISIFELSGLCRPLKRLHRDRSAATLRIDDPLQVCFIQPAWSASQASSRLVLLPRS